MAQVNSTVPKRVKPKAKPRGGSRKGIPNKVTKELKDMILGALNAVGGQKYLARQAEENPNAFMSLLGKVLPMKLAGQFQFVPLVVEADGNDD